MTCFYCKRDGEVISPRHLNARRCAFSDTDGTFNTSNYCCSALRELVDYIERMDDTVISSILTAEDETMMVANLAHLHIDSNGENIIGVVLHRYKSRGRMTGAIVILDENKTAPLTQEIIEAILKRI